jgi:plastocyanin
MSLVQDSLRAFAAGAAVCCIVYAAAAVPVESRAAITEFAFKPDTITVPVGTTVVWENKDDIPHTVVAVDRTFSFPGARHR